MSTLIAARMIKIFTVNGTTFEVNRPVLIFLVIFVAVLLVEWCSRGTQ